MRRNLCSSFLFYVANLLLTFTLTQAQYSAESDPFLIGKSPEEVRVIFQAKARNASDKDPHRWERVEQTLIAASGIYNYSHPLQKKRPEIQKSVMIVVLEFGKRDESHHYKVYLKNFICYVKNYQFKLLVFVALHIITDAATEVKELQDMGVLVLDYPDELFWELHSSKETGITRGRGHADYDRQYPAFKAYGAIVMLVPILEVLLHGYNVLFMDVDIALLHDPVPFMTQGTANIALSIETRHCLEFYSTTYPHHFDWYMIEPNTGLMYLRRGSETAQAFKLFLERIIERNLLNDQRVFERHAIGLEWNGDCNGDIGGWKEYNEQMRIKAAAVDNNNSSSSAISGSNRLRRRLMITPHNNSPDHNQQQQQRRSLVTTDNSLINSSPQPVLSKLQQKLLALRELVNITAITRKQKKPTFCFFNELHFQNGIIAISCPNSKNRNIRDEYILELAKHGIPASRSDNSKRSPITVHVNYADKKTHELQVRGLWLLHPDYDNVNYNTPQQFCWKPKFHVENTYYGQHNWTAELNHIHQRRQELLYELTNNTVVKTLSDGSVYMLDEHRVRHLVPDVETFEARYGENHWGSIKVLPSGMMNNLTMGEPLPSLKDQLRPETNQTNEKLLQQLTNNTLVKTANNGAVYMLDEHRVRHLVPDGETFEARFGESSWSQIKVLSVDMMNYLTLGEPLKSIKAAVEVKKKNLLRSYLPRSRFLSLEEKTKKLRPE